MNINRKILDIWERAGLIKSSEQYCLSLFRLLNDEVNPYIDGESEI